MHLLHIVCELQRFQKILSLLINNNQFPYEFRGFSSSSYEKLLSCISVWKWSPNFNSHLKTVSENQHKHLLNTCSVWQSEVIGKKNKNHSRNEFCLTIIEIVDKMRLLNHNNKKHESFKGNNKNNLLFHSLQREFAFCKRSNDCQTSHFIHIITNSKIFSTISNPEIPI